ncbi:MAG: type IV conjugative transfer system protein TraE [Burkholderiales bacterium]|nr:type IV conjugative transfer system protein TraE [Burkholderiales bacterium]
MEQTVHDNELIKAKKALRVRELVILALVGCLLLALILAVKNAGRERTIVSPPVVRDTFWVDSNDADPKYLQEMSTYFVLLTNNISPSNVEYQNKLFLNYVNPNQQGALSAQLMEQAQRVKRNQLVTMFYIKGFKIDSYANKVVINGQLDTLIGDKLISSMDKYYRLGYQLINGKLYINEYGEVKSNNPWGEFIK